MDDIADLTFTSSSLKPNSSNQKGTSSFDYLSASIARSSSSPNYQPISSKLNASSSPSSSSSFKSLTASRPSQPLSSSKSGQDAFSSIFDQDLSTSSSKPTNTSNLTLSQRLEAAQNQKLQQLSSNSTSSYPNRSATLTPTSIPRVRSTSPLHSQPLGYPQTQTPSNLSRTSSEPWDFDLLDGSKPSQIASSQFPTSAINSTQPLTQSNISLEIDTFSDLNGSSNDNLPKFHLGVSQNETTPSQSNSLLGDEFGPSEIPHQQLGSITLEDGPTPDDDILGLLGAPIDQIQANQIKVQASEILRQSSQAGPSHPTHNLLRSKSVGRADSPPPHILGQVVEVGFSLSLSRQALVQTRNPNTGDWDVISAVESLLSAQSQPLNPHQDDITPVSNSQSRRQQFRTASHDGRLTGNGHAKQPETTNNTLAGVSTKELQDQAAELLAQASAYGTTALGKAASFWKQGKASLTKVIEDQTGSSSTTAHKDVDSLKPKWMKESQTLSASDINEKQALSTLVPFSDGDLSNIHDHRATPSTSNQLDSGSRQPYVSSARRKVVERTMRNNSPRESPSVRDSNPSISLFSTDEDPSLSVALPSARSQCSSSKPQASRAISSFNFSTLPIISVSQQQVKQSELHRNKGNDLFKQGQYGSAETAYTQALEALQDPTNLHPTYKEIYFGSLPVYNNRASARLKNGDGKGAKEDVERVIEVIFCEDREMKASIEELNKRLEWNQATRIPNELRNNLNIPEQLGKALGKRAKIFEDFEKWDQAKIDWEICRSLGSGVIRGAGGLKMISEGLTRCSKALNKDQSNFEMNNTNNTNEEEGSNMKMRSKAINSNNNGSIHTKVKMSKEESRRLNEKVNEAVKKLRETDERLELESNQRLESKDWVDQKISNWKNGKESNLRALLASLDLVLWDRLQWSKVNMSELLSPNQVKSKYLKAISKVHPDKIPKDASIVEQMIAKSVFTILNEAWISMQN